MVLDTGEHIPTVENAAPQDLIVVRRRKHILDLPAEILETLFRHTVMFPGDDDMWQDPGYGERNLERLAAPFRLAAVCRTWRKVMLGYGALWSYICIPEPTEWEFGLQAPDFLGLMFGRSGVAPVSVLLPWDTPCVPWANHSISREILRRCIETLCQHSNRWLRLEFRAPMGSLAEGIIQDFLGQPTEELRNLHVSFVSRPSAQWQDESFYRPLTGLLPHAPKLYRADLILEHFASSTLPMEKLHILDLDIPRFPHQLCNLLSLTPNLRHLSLSHNACPTAARPEAVPDLGRMQERVFLEHLDRIVVDGSLNRRSLCLDVLARFAWLPNLTELDLPWGMTWLDESHMDNITIFLKEQGSRLRTLTLREDRNLKWWDRMPKAQRKTIMELSHEQLWILLSQRDPVSGDWVAPHLQILRFEGLAFFPGEGMAFREFHAKRCVPGELFRIDVLWLPETGPEGCQTYQICTELFGLPWSEAEWNRLLDDGESTRLRYRRCDRRYFSSSVYVAHGPKHAF